MKKQRSILYRIYLGHPIGESVYGVQKEASLIRRWQAQALGIADRNVGKVSGRTEFYQRLKALSVAPVKEPTKGQAVIVGVPMPGSTMRITSIKALRELIPGLGLKEAKDAIDCVDGRASFLTSGAPQANYHLPITDIETANRQAKAMREAGCTVQVNLS